MPKSEDDYVQQDLERTLSERIVKVLQSADGYMPSFRIAEELEETFDTVNDLVARLYWDHKHDIQRVVHTDRVEYAIFELKADG